jgi:hypothetical protein
VADKLNEQGANVQIMKDVFSLLMKNIGSGAIILAILM